MDKEGQEFFYRDESGAKQDAELHEEMLKGDHSGAVEVGKGIARKLGVSEENLAYLYD